MGTSVGFLRTGAIIKDMSLRYNIPKKDIEEMLALYYRQIKEIIESGEKDNPDSFKTIMIPNVGKIYYSKKKMEKIQYYKQLKDKRNESEGLQN